MGQTHLPHGKERFRVKLVSLVPRKLTEEAYQIVKMQVTIHPWIEHRANKYNKRYSQPCISFSLSRDAKT